MFKQITCTPLNDNRHEYAPTSKHAVARVLSKVLPARALVAIFFCLLWPPPVFAEGVLLAEPVSGNGVATTDSPSFEAARVAAIDLCGANQWRCNLIFRFRNSCAALAYNRLKTEFYPAAAPTPDAAASIAQRDCVTISSAQNASCSILVRACDHSSAGTGSFTTAFAGPLRAEPKVNSLASSQVTSTPPPVERIVERVVQVPVEKIVERTVQVPVDRIVEKVVRVAKEPTWENLWSDLKFLTSRHVENLTGYQTVSAPILWFAGLGWVAAGGLLVFAIRSRRKAALSPAAVRSNALGAVASALELTAPPSQPNQSQPTAKTNLAAETPRPGPFSSGSLQPRREQEEGLEQPLRRHPLPGPSDMPSTSSRGMSIGFGVGALITAVLAIFVPLYGIVVSIVAVLCAVIAGLAGDRAFGTATAVIVAVNSFFLSPSLWLMFASDAYNSKSAMVFPFVVALCVAPFIAMIVNSAGKAASGR